MHITGPRLRLAAGVTFVLVSFALNSAITRWIVADDRLDPGLTTNVRFLAGAGMLLLIMGTRSAGAAVFPRRRHIAPTVALAAYAFLISYGYQFIGAAAGTFVFYALVLLTMTLGTAATHRRIPTPTAITGGILALAGLAILSLGRDETISPLGVILLAGTGIAWGIYSLLGRGRKDPLAFTSANFALFGAILLLPTAYLLARPGSLVISSPGLAAAIIMGALTTALSYAVWYWALGHLDGTQAGTYQLAIPVMTAILGIVWLDEQATVRLLVAGLLVMAGMALATPRRRPTP